MGRGSRGTAGYQNPIYQGGGCRIGRDVIQAGDSIKTDGDSIETDGDRAGADGNAGNAPESPRPGSHRRRCVLVWKKLPAEILVSAGNAKMIRSAGIAPP